MATNNFKPFANGNSANVTSQSDYEALPALSSGFTAGKASSAQVNKALRQGSVMSSVLAQFIANASGNDVLDNGNVTTILTNLLLALKSNGAGSFLQISNNLNEISSAGATAIAAALANLGLSDALHRGDAKILTGTRVSTAESARAIGERAIGGCQFMQAYKAPDAPNQTDYWQVIVMPDASGVGDAPLSVIALSLASGTVAIGNGTTSGLAWTNLSTTTQLDNKQPLDATLTTLSGKTQTQLLQYLGLTNALKKGDAKILTGTRVSTAESARAIGERAIGGCQFMQAYKAPDAPNQTDYWQVIVMPDTSDVGGAPLAVIAISLGGGNVAIGNGTTSGLAWTTLSKDSQVVKSMRFGAVEQGNVFQNPGFADSLGYVITGVQNADSNDTPDKLQRRTIQMNINNQWLTLGA